MPIYEYDCPACGPFTRLVHLADSAAPAECPDCGQWSRRLISAPSLSLMSSENRGKWERNERAQHEPRRARRSSCGCAGVHTCGSGARSSSAASEHGDTSKPVFQRQTKKHARPWMLGH
ncbi:MAG TPA: zinc ribbon domain-containing protein [Thioalkalivibrio sp.]|nr:zinc ribbon domain-containing protein [Thioalkalivibrio sp.]